MSDTAASQPALSRVSLTSVDVPFGRLVLFFVKAGLAAIPAMIILMLTIGAVGAVLRGLFRIGFWGIHGGGFY